MLILELDCPANLHWDLLNTFMRVLCKRKVRTENVSDTSNFSCILIFWIHKWLLADNSLKGGCSQRILQILVPAPCRLSNQRTVEVRWTLRELWGRKETETHARVASEQTWRKSCKLQPRIATSCQPKNVRGQAEQWGLCACKLLTRSQRLKILLIESIKTTTPEPL